MTKINPIQSNYSYYRNLLHHESDANLRHNSKLWENASPLRRILYKCFFLTVDVQERSRAARDILDGRRIPKYFSSRRMVYRPNKT